MSSYNSLSLFHPTVADWFLSRVGEPTDLQARAWPEIAKGGNVLVTAPTGSGKTLTAFLWAIDQFATAHWSTGQTKVLYVSPLKALNNDIQRNLLRPIAELQDRFESAGEPFPALRVLTRSGDTPQSERQRMQRHPPEILITTPESLNLLLSSRGGRSFLTQISTVILDEIHSVVGAKRGVHLITAVDRLVPLCGEFQRIALSATIRPAERVSDFIGGFKMEGDHVAPAYVPRKVSIVRSNETKRFDVKVRFPLREPDRTAEDPVWRPLVDEFKQIINRNRSTLLFANSRRLCEELTLKINDGENHPVAYAHHGSLSREIRAEVEGRLKEGTLRAIVATNSLELGIDIGTLDEVVLIQSPPSVSSAIQRIGRSGHRVGEVSRSEIFPTHNQDLLEAAVLSSAVRSGDIEKIQPLRCPLDVLAQVIISMVGIETWDIDQLFNRLRTSHPYNELERGHFDLVLNMLAGRYAENRIRELNPRVSIDRIDSTASGRSGALQALYMSGGTIPDRGYFHLRHNDSNALIGDLDEEFVWEASVGQMFAFGSQKWKIQRITHNDVFVSPGNPGVSGLPFWKTEGRDRDFHFSELIALFLEEADDRLDDANFIASLQTDHCLDHEAADHLTEHLKRQKEVTGCSLPHRHHLVVETMPTGPGGAPGNQVVVHTLWGGKVNRPFGMALESAWERRFGLQLEVYAQNDSVVLVLPHQVTGEEILSLVTPSTLESLLRNRLERSGFFGARFREAAGRALLMNRRRFNERMPLWLSRLKSKKLLDSVLRYEDFPILLEAWRTCLQDEFDLDSLQILLSELESGAISWSEVHAQQPSPFAQNLSWGQINQYMYEDDRPDTGKTSRLKGSLLRDLVFMPGLRPTVSKELVERFELSRKRLIPGYPPGTARELVEWVKERVAIPTSEWEQLEAEIKRDQAEDADLILKSAQERLVYLEAPDAREPLVVSLEAFPRLLKGFFENAEGIRLSRFGPESAELPHATDLSEGTDELLTTLLSEWIQFYGPISIDFVCDTLGIEPKRLQPALEDLFDSERLVSGRLVLSSEDDLICDSENFEVLLRMKRSEAVPPFEPLNIGSLFLFFAAYHGITNPQPTVEALSERLQQLLCLPAAAELWESEILPARMSPYSTSNLENLMQESGLMWVGCGNRRVAFCFDDDVDLVLDPESDKDETPTLEVDDLFPDTSARYPFQALLRSTKTTASALSERLWSAVWSGQVTNDTFSTLRRGIENKFDVLDPTESYEAKGRLSSRGFRSWKRSAPFSGNWHRLNQTENSTDLLEIEERKKDCVRLLLDRYGILFRELLARETPRMSWSPLFRTLRLMELSGEVLTGYFFDGIPGPQFISHAAYRMLQNELPKEAIYWINAADPVSLCGLQLDPLKGTMPSRIATTHLVYHGPELVVLSQRNGKRLTFQVPPGDEHLQEYLISIRHLLYREFQPLRQITVETINDEDAAGSPYVDHLRTAFDVRLDHKAVKLYRRLE